MLYPMLALMAWTLCVALYLLTQRILAVRRGEVSVGYFRVYPDDVKVPPRMLAAARHYDNLFQMPVLFYMACVTSLTLGLNGPTSLAWGFVVTRLLHSFIHMGYNNVLHRLIAFMAGNVLLIGIWVMIALQLGRP